MTSKYQHATILELLLESDPDVLAAQSTDRIKRDLESLGVNSKAVSETVQSTVASWLESATGSSEAKPIGDLESNLPITAFARAPIKRQSPPPISMASVKSQTETPHIRPNVYILKAHSLTRLGVKPYVRFQIKRCREETLVTFAMEPIYGRTRTGRKVRPMRGSVDVCLSRGNGRPRVTVKFGPKYLHTVSLPQYTHGEEKYWRIKVSISSRKPWAQAG